MSEGPLYANAFVFDYQSWPAGEELDLSLLTRGKQGDAAARMVLKSSRYTPASDGGTAMTGFLQRAVPPRNSR